MHRFPRFAELWDAGAHPSNWVRDFHCTSRLSCWEASPEPHSSFSYTLLSQSGGWDGVRRGGGGLSCHHAWSPASVSFLMGLTATAQVPEKPWLLPRLPRVSALGSERCCRAQHLSLRSGLCSESGGKANKRQVSLLVFIICIIIAPQCLVVNQNRILLALCKPRAQVRQSLPQRAYNLCF